MSCQSISKLQHSPSGFSLPRTFSSCLYLQLSFFFSFLIDAQAASIQQASRSLVSPSLYSLQSLPLCFVVGVAVSPCAATCDRYSDHESRKRGNPLAGSGFSPRFPSLPGPTLRPPYGFDPIRSLCSFAFQSSDLVSCQLSDRALCLASAPPHPFPSHLRNLG